MKVGSVCYLSILVFSFQFFSHNNISGIVFVFVFVFVLMARSGAAASQLPPPQLSAAISQQYGIHIDLNSYESVRRLCICFDPLFEPKCAVSRLNAAGLWVDREIPELKKVKWFKNVSIRSLLLMNAHSTLIPIEIPCVQSQLSADLLSSAKAAIAAREAAGPPPYKLRSESLANSAAAFDALTATHSPEVCLDLQVSRRFRNSKNFVYVLRNLLRLNLTNDLSLENDYDYLANVRLDQDPDFKVLFGKLTDTTKTALENNAKMVEEMMVEVDRQGGTLTEELKNTIRGSIFTFTPIWPESIHFAGAGAETFKHRIVVITDGENDHYEPTPEWGEEESKIMQKIAFGISFKAVIMIQTSDTERICIDFVLNLNKKMLFDLFSDLFTKGSVCVPYSQCWFYLDDLISIILESQEFKDRISEVINEYITGELTLFVETAYDNPSSSFAVVDAGCNHPIGYLSPGRRPGHDPGHDPSDWTWNDTDFKIIGERKVRGGGVMVDLLNSSYGGGGISPLYHCTFPESMRDAFVATNFTDPTKVLHEGQFSLKEASQGAVAGSQPDDEMGAAASPAESRAKRIVANIFKTIHTLRDYFLCRLAAGGRGGALKKKRKSIRTRRASRARRSRGRRSRRSRK